MKNLVNDYKESVWNPWLAFIKRHPVATTVYISACGLMGAAVALGPVIEDKIEEIKFKKEMKKDLKGYLSED